MEDKLNGDTKLWAEKKAAAEKQAAQVKLNLEKSKEARQKAATDKVKAAQEKLTAAEKVKAEMEKVLAKEKADVVNIKKQLEEATSRLHKVGGYKPAAPAVHAEPKNAAPTMSLVVSALAVLVMQMI